MNTMRELSKSIKNFEKSNGDIANMERETKKSCLESDFEFRNPTSQVHENLKIQDIKMSTFIVLQKYIYNLRG